MPTTRHEIELALNSAAYRRVQKAQEEVFGGEFWQKSYRGASKSLKAHMMTVSKVGSKTAEQLSRQFDGMFQRSASGFGKGVEKAARSGSKGYIKAMKKAADRISKIQADNDEDRAKAVQNIIDQELGGLKERIKLEKKASRGSGSKAPSPRLGGRASAFKGRAEQLGGALQTGSTKVGGKAGSMLGKAGGMVADLGKFAGAAGAILGVAAAVGLLAKKAYDIQKDMKSLNTQMTQSISTGDLVSAGFLDVGKGITSIRKEFMLGVIANAKYRMTTDEAVESMNALISTGVTLDKVNSQLGRDYTSTAKTARDIAESTRAYSRVMGTSVSEVGSFMGDIMLNINYSFGEAKAALASISNGAATAGISTGVFFGKIQSLNSQLDLMNGSLAVQVDVLADISKSGPLGLEKSASAAASIMGKLDEQAGRTLIAYVGKAKAMDVLRDRLSRVDEQFSKGGLTPALIRRLEITRTQIKEALEGDMLGVMHQFEGGLMDEAGNLQARFEGIAKLVNKSMEDLTSGDLQAIMSDPANIEQLKSLDILGGSTEEVNTNLMAMIGLIEANGGVTEAIKKMQLDALNPMAADISEDQRQAQNMLRATEDIGKILTNIKEFMLSTLYDVLLGIYEILLEPLGSDQDKAVLEYDKAIRQVRREEKTATGSRKDRLATMGNDLTAEREGIRGMDNGQFQNFVDRFGGGSSSRKGKVNTALDQRLGTGRDHLEGGAQGGDLTFSSHALGAPIAPGTTIGATRGPEADARRAKEAESRKVAISSSEAQREEAAKILKDYHLTVGEMQKEVTDSRGAGGWASFALSNPKAARHNESLALLWAISQGSVPKDIAVDRLTKAAQTSISVPALADGGVVNRPTMALIGEAGPEAVVPLKGGNAPGGFHFHVHGNVYGIDELDQMMGKALREYSRSQRV